MYTYILFKGTLFYYSEPESMKQFGKFLYLAGKFVTLVSVAHAHTLCTQLHNLCGT